jgi:hypothetical protein
MASFRLDNDLSERITALESDLRGAAQTFRDEWEERSERWQESDAGTDADAWIESLDQAADELSAITPKPE